MVLQGWQSHFDLQTMMLVWNKMAIPFNPLWSLTSFIVDDYLQIIEWCYRRILLILHPQDQRGARLSDIPGFQTVSIWSKFLQVIFCYGCYIWGGGHNLSQKCSIWIPPLAARSGASGTLSIVSSVSTRDAEEPEDCAS